MTKRMEVAIRLLLLIAGLFADNAAARKAITDFTKDIRYTSFEPTSDVGDVSE